MSRIYRQLPPRGTRLGIAFSGGLDTRCAVAWLAEKGLEVYCYTADLAQPDEKLREIQARLKELKPQVDEYEKLLAAEKALAGVGSSKPSAPTRTRARKAQLVTAGSCTNVRNCQPAHLSYHPDNLGLFEGNERIAVAVVDLRPAVIALAGRDNDLRDFGRHVAIKRHLEGQQRQDLCCLAEAVGLR